MQADLVDSDPLAEALRQAGRLDDAWSALSTRLRRYTRYGSASRSVPAGAPSEVFGRATAVALVTLKTRVLPRWLGWLAAVTAPLLLVNGMFLDAEFGPAFLLFLLWTLLASVVLTVRRSGARSPAEPVASSLTAWGEGKVAGTSAGAIVR